jgi:uncharacterized membrane protein YeaQ/YmgE (transglycosylase-associated protein family)
VIGVIEYKFDHSLSLICSILCSAVFNQSAYPFLQGVPFAAVRLWLPSLFRGELARAKTCLMQKKEKTMSIIWMLVVGLVVGAIAKLMMPGKDPGGIFVTMLLGVAGALVVGFLGRGLGWYREGEPVGLFASIIGAIVLLALYRLVAARRAV